MGIASSTLLWLFASLIIVCLIVFAYGFYQQFERNTMATIEHELGNLATVLAEDTSDDVQSVSRMLAMRSAELGVLPVVRNERERDQVRAMLRDTVAGSRHLSGLSWFDAQGRLVAATYDDASVVAELKDMSLLQLHRDKAKESARVSEPVNHLIPGREFVPLTQGVRGPNGQFRGILVGEFNLDHQNAVYRTLALGEGGRVSVFTTAGRVVTTFPLRPDLPKQAFLEHPTFQKLLTSLPAFIRAPSILTGRDSYFAVRAVRDSPFLLLVSREAGEAREGLVRQRAYIAAVTLGLAIAIFLFSGLFARQLKQRELAEAALADSRMNLMAAQRVARLGSWSLDIRSGEIDFSEQAAEILELPAARPLHTADSVREQLIHPEDRNEVLEAFRRVIAGQVVEGEYRIVSQTGRIRWLRTRTEATLSAQHRAEIVHGTIQDITQIKEAQIKLSESERGYRVLSDNMRDLVSLHELDGTLRFASHSFKRITGYAPNELVGHSFYLWLHPDDVATLRNEIDRQLRMGRVDLHSEFRYRHQAGHYLWLECLAASVHDGAEGITHIQASSRDVTERRRALSALRDSEERFRRIIEFTSDLYWETDSEYRFTQLSMGAQKYLGIVPRSIGTRRWESPYDRAPQEVWMQHKADIVARRPFKDLIITMVDPDSGKMLEYTSISGEPFYDEDGRFRGYRGIGRFITQQKKYELDLAERTRQLSDVNAELNREAGRRRELERRLLLAIEKELAQVGLELHDELGQNLTGTALLAKTLQKKLAEKSLPEASDAARVHALVNETIRQTRLISHGLSPHIMGPEGLVEALQQLADDVNSLGTIECRFECDGEPHITDTLIARGLYRIAQEAVNNALKHSQAKNIMIELTALGGETRLAVIDNGIGIRSHDAEPLSDSALHSIKYRSGVMGASLTVSRRPGGGTEIAVALPVDSAAPAVSRTWENG